MSLLLLFTYDTQDSGTSQENRERVRREQKLARLRALMRRREEEELVVVLLRNNSGSYYG